MSNVHWFPYGPGLSHFGDRPCVPIAFVHRETGKLTEPIPILIDSGADQTLFPVTVADQLGVNLEGATEEHNRLGRYLDPHDALLAVVAGVHIMLRPRFAVDENVLLLGRWDFLSNFKLTIDEIGQRFALEPYPAGVRGHHPAQAAGCGIHEPDPAPAWLNGAADR